jgi:hypothetical protein
VTAPADPWAGQRPWPTVQPPPMAGLAVTYLTPLMAPVPVSTRRPRPDPNADVAYPNGYLRCESAGGTWMARSEIFFDASVILHGYSDYEHETLAEDICGHALGWAGNSQGLTLTVTDEITGQPVDWYVTYSRISALATEHADPLVRLTRFRGMATWRVSAVALSVSSP